MTPTELVILGLLAEGPRHGYELLREIERRRLTEYLPLATTFGGFYYHLKHLEKEGLIAITGTARRGGRPEQRVFSLSEGGRARLLERLRALLGDPAERIFRDPIWVALSFGHLIPLSEVAAALTQQLTHRRAMLTDLRGRRAALPAQVPVGMLRVAVLEHAIAWSTADAAWLENLLATVRSLRAAGHEFAPEFPPRAAAPAPDHAEKPGAPPVSGVEASEAARSSQDQGAGQE